MKSSLKAIALFLALATFAYADSLTGTIKNGTTGKPAGGDEVVLLTLGQGMEEAGRTKADSKGNFSFNLPNLGGAPHLVRVIHQGVTYHRMAPPGTTSVEAEVFDVAQKIDGLSVVADVMRMQTQGNNLQVVRHFAVSNTSKPPRTQMNDQNFEFYLPDGAQVDESMAKTSGGQPINSAPVPQKEKNRFGFIFPLRPGQTEFQVTFHLPYSGEANLDPKTLYPVEHIVVVLPKSMQFSGPASFQSMQDPGQTDSTVQVLSSAQPGQPMAFKVSGTGTLPERNENASASAGGQSSGNSRPGGGLGPPIDSSDPLEKYRWPILGVFTVALAVGGYFIAKRSPARAAAGASRSIDDEAAEVPRPAARPAKTPVATAPPATAASPSGHSVMLLAALKEELFQLEVERQQGYISQQEYEKNKVALDQTLQRAVKRDVQKV